MEATTDKLWKKYVQNRSDLNLRNQLHTRYLALARSQAKFSFKSVPTISFEELLGAAYFGLMQAIEKYCPDRNAKFETFSRHRISGAIKDWLRENDVNSTRLNRDFTRKRNAAEVAARSDLEGTSPFELSKRMNISLDLYLKREAIERWSDQYSLDYREKEESINKPQDEYAYLDSGIGEPSDALQREFFIEFLTRGLIDRELKTILMYYLEERNLAEIGRILNLCESRISQIRTSALQNMGKKLEGMSFEFALSKC